MSRSVLAIPRNLQKRDVATEQRFVRKTTNELITVLRKREKWQPILAPAEVKHVAQLRSHRHPIFKLRPVTARPIRPDLRKAFEEAHYMLLPEVHEHEQDVVSKSTLDRAIRFVTVYAERSKSLRQKLVPAPYLENAEAGAVDVTWKLSDSVVTVRFPKDAQKPVLVYGKRGDIVLKSALPLEVIEETLILDPVL